MRFVLSGFVCLLSLAVSDVQAGSTTYNNSHVSAGNSVNITSGGDTNVIGGTVKANQVTANVGGNLNVESLQDTATSQAS